MRDAVFSSKRLVMQTYNKIYLLSFHYKILHNK